MKFVLKLFSLAVLALVLLSACSPATPAPPSVSTRVIPAETSQPAPVATSRGDKLEASDPASVKYGAGRPVLVEFFRYT